MFKAAHFLPSIAAVLMTSVASFAQTAQPGAPLVGSQGQDSSCAERKDAAETYFAALRDQFRKRADDGVIAILPALLSPTVRSGISAGKSAGEVWTLLRESLNTKQIFDQDELHVRYRAFDSKLVVYAYLWDDELAIHLDDETAIHIKKDGAVSVASEIDEVTDLGLNTVLWSFDGLPLEIFASSKSKGKLDPTGGVRSGYRIYTQYRADTSDPKKYHFVNVEVDLEFMTFRDGRPYRPVADRLAATQTIYETYLKPVGCRK